MYLPSQSRVNLTHFVAVCDARGMSLQEKMVNMMVEAVKGGATFQEAHIGMALSQFKVPMSSDSGLDRLAWTLISRQYSECQQDDLSFPYASCPSTRTLSLRHSRYPPASACLRRLFRQERRRKRWRRRGRSSNSAPRTGATK